MDQNQRDYEELDRRRRRTVKGERWRSTLRRLVVPSLIMCVIWAGVVGFCAGGLWETKQFYLRQYERDKAVIGPVLSADPRFSKVTIHPHSAGGVNLEGEVATAADGARLRAEFLRLFGETEAWRVEVLVKQTGKSVMEKSGK